MKSFLQHIAVTLEEKKQSFLRGVKYRGGRQDHEYEFDHGGKDVSVSIDTMPSNKQQVNFSVGGRMTRMGTGDGNKPSGAGSARQLYKNVGKVIRAHHKLGRGTKDGYEVRTAHDTGMPDENGEVKGGRPGTRTKVTGRLLKKLATRINKKYSQTPAGDSGTGARMTGHTVT